MAVEYPILAFIASLMFAVVILSTLFVYVYIVSEINRVPVISGIADARVIFENAVVEVKIMHERGEPVVLQRIVLYTELGAITCTVSPRSCTTPVEGLVVTLKLVNIGEDGLVYPGSTSYVVAEITGENVPHLFFSGKSYDAVLFFDKGLIVLKYALAYIIR
ncbi:MAG: hypothetical protein QW721_01660 [Desulfurococcaceae archaeon]